MFGQIQKEVEKLSILMTTTDDRVDKLVNFINEHSPNEYDYPVHDVAVEPVSEGDPQFVAWLKKQTKKLPTE